MGCTVEELLDRMSAVEIAEWQAYRQIEMLPDERLEFLLATLTTVLANVNRGEDTDPFTLLDFMPWLDQDDEEPEPLSQADMIALVESLNVAFGGSDERNNSPAS